jgi:hypothetical protein
MASTITLAQSIAWAQSFGMFRPLTIGQFLEPAITNANIVLNTILNSPFKWNWNRNEITFFTQAGLQDYTIADPTFGFIEKAGYVLAAQITQTSLTSNVATYTANNNFVVGGTVTVTGTNNGSGVFNISKATIVSASSTQFTVNLTNSNIPAASDTGIATSGQVSEIPNIADTLGTGNELGSPAHIAPYIDDNAGNITFRTLPAADQIYRITIIAQKRIPKLFASTSDKWTPVPDHYSHIYNPGFLALAMAFWNDPRWQQFNQKFIAGLLSAAEGIDDQDKDIFLLSWQESMNTAQMSGVQRQQGTQARGI